MSSTGTESFTIGMHPSQKPLPTQPSMRLAYAPDGTAIYKPVASSPAAGPPFSARTNEPFNTNTNEAAFNTNTNETAARGPPFNVNTNESGARGPPFNVNTNESGARGPPFNANTNNNEAGGLGPAFNANTKSGNEPMMKKKRGRPRKYGPDGGMSLAVPSDGATSAGVPPGFSPGGAPGSGEGVRKSKGGRPPGSSNKKKQLAALGSSGIGFTPHVITVKAGEDVSAKIMAFSQNGPRAICVLSANGAISNVTLRQAATSGGTVTYEGRFEILSLSGSFLVSESVGQRSRTGGLSVSLAGPDGRVLGGSVAGLLTAASPVQVVVGSFIADGKKEKKQVSHPDPISAPVPVMAANVTAGGSSSPSRGTMSESSGGPNSPPNQSMGLFGNNNQQGFANFPWK